MLLLLMLLTLLLVVSTVNTVVTASKARNFRSYRISNEEKLQLQLQQAKLSAITTPTTAVPAVRFCATVAE